MEGSEREICYKLNFHQIVTYLPFASFHTIFLWGFGMDSDLFFVVSFPCLA